MSVGFPVVRATLRWRLVLLASAPFASVVAAQQSIATSEVFRRYASGVAKVQVIETRSSAKTTIGSAFYVTNAGHLVTNYHVVSELIHSPERYRAELVDASGTRPVRVLAVDVVHDLAVLGSDARPDVHFAVGHVSPVQGNRLYALGHPEDLGLSIVEGTYNGFLPHTLHPRLHFTGSLNPGMSGGPTLTEDGRVVGINVSTAGNQLSFLIPADRAASLLQVALRAGARLPSPNVAEVGQQLRAHQDVYLQEVFAGAPKTVELGPYRLVTEPATFFRCWADATRSEELPYEKVQHRCSTDDYLFLAGDQGSSVVSVDHELISTRALSPVRFFAAYSAIFASDNTPIGDEDHVTNWKCGTRNVRNKAAAMRAVLCLRRYRKLGELYDGVLKVAVLGRRDTGLVSTLTLSGVTIENIDRLSRRFLELIAWK